MKVAYDSNYPIFMVHGDCITPERFWLQAFAEDDAEYVQLMTEGYIISRRNIDREFVQTKFAEEKAKQGRV